MGIPQPVPNLEALQLFYSDGPHLQSQTTTLFPPFCLHRLQWQALSLLHSCRRRTSTPSPQSLLVPIPEASSSSPPSSSAKLLCPFQIQVSDRVFLLRCFHRLLLASPSIKPPEIQNSRRNCIRSEDPICRRDPIEIRTRRPTRKEDPRPSISPTHMPTRVLLNQQLIWFSLIKPAIKTKPSLNQN